MTNINFKKMHGLGNDFVIVDLRSQNVEISPAQISAISNRNTGVGCDQFVLIEESKNADCGVRFFNEDGSESGACGNATRCVASLIMQENSTQKASLETKNGILNCTKVGKNVQVEMGQYIDDWQKIPLAKDVDVLNVPIHSGDLKNPVAVSMGNPHAVFFVENNQEINLQQDGADLEVNPIFPERANIGVATIVNKNQINLRVWERGVGETQACGTGACAAAVAAVKTGRCDFNQDIKINLLGGELVINVDEEKYVKMTGSATFVFEGSFDLNNFKVV